MLVFQVKHEAVLYTPNIEGLRDFTCFAQSEVLYICLFYQNLK